MTEPDFWNDNIAAQKTSQELNELKMKYETDHRISIYLTSDNSLGDRTIVRELIVRDSMYDMATQDDEITGLADCTIVQ